MADTARYSPGKRLWTAAIAEGVPLDDDKSRMLSADLLASPPD